jgi:hypothetical protein
MVLSCPEYAGFLLERRDLKGIRTPTELMKIWRSRIAVIAVAIWS